MLLFVRVSLDNLYEYLLVQLALCLLHLHCWLFFPRIFASRQILKPKKYITMYKVVLLVHVYESYINVYVGTRPFRLVCSMTSINGATDSKHSLIETRIGDCVSLLVNWPGCSPFNSSLHNRMSAPILESYPRIDSPEPLRISYAFLHLPWHHIHD